MLIEPRHLPLLALSLIACAHAQTPTGGVPVTTEAAPTRVPEEVQVRVLVVAFQGAKEAAHDQQRTPEQALERAGMLTDMGRGGEQLATLVSKYSDWRGPSDDVGVMRARTAATDSFEHAVAQVAIDLAVGSVSDPVLTDHGYVVVERLREPSSAPQRIAAKHILITYAGSPQHIEGATRSEAEARALAEDIAKQAKAPGADWDALASRYTEEPGGKERHGDLGSFGHGQMVPAFEAAAFALKVGEVSGVVQSPFGFHVIQRTE